MARVLLSKCQRKPLRGYQRPSKGGTNTKRATHLPNVLKGSQRGFLLAKVGWVRRRFSKGHRKEGLFKRFRRGHVARMSIRVHTREAKEGSLRDFAEAPTASCFLSPGRGGEFLHESEIEVLG